MSAHQTPVQATTPQDEVIVELNLLESYRFDVQFQPPGMPTLVTDLAPPLGAHLGPNPERLLAAAVANCLSASLLFALRKFAQQSSSLHTRAALQMARSAQGRMRVGRMAVDLHLGAPAAQMPHLARVLAQFEAFCSVTESVRAAFPVDVHVFDGDGVQVKP